MDCYELQIVFLKKSVDNQLDGQAGFTFFLQ